MFQNLPSWCPCGCESSYLFEWDAVVPPRKGEMLYYTCPRSQDLLSFKNKGLWSRTTQDASRESVKVMLRV